MYRTKIITALLAAGILAGCRMPAKVVPEVGHFYINPQADFSTINRVVVFEFENRSTLPELSIALTDALTEALQKKHLFSISALHRTSPAWRKLDLAESSSYSDDELCVIRKELKTDAVLFGSITRYYPYPHMLVALHLKLINLRDGRLLWALEQVWDSTDKRVEGRMRQFFTSQMRSGYQPMDWQLLVTSPRAFNKFVIFEVGQTFQVNNSYTAARRFAKHGKNFRKNESFLEKTLEIPVETLKFTRELTKMGTGEAP